MLFPLLHPLILRLDSHFDVDLTDFQKFVDDEFHNILVVRRPHSVRHKSVQKHCTFREFLSDVGMTDSSYNFVHPGTEFAIAFGGTHCPFVGILPTIQPTCEYRVLIHRLRILVTDFSAQ